VVGITFLYYVFKIFNVYSGRCDLLCQDDMNLTEEKKGPLRSMPVSQKKIMLEKFFQSKVTSGVCLY